MQIQYQYINDESEIASVHVIVIDISASMDEEDWAPNRLAGAQTAVRSYANAVWAENPRAGVALVAYSECAFVACRACDAASKKEMFNAIEQLSVRSSTNITAGLIAAQQLLRPGRPCQVVLLSDGVHNVGSGPEHVASQVREIAMLECVGVAGTPRDVDPVLKKIASTRPDGSKAYRWIGDASQLKTHLVRIAGRLSKQ